MQFKHSKNFIMKNLLKLAGIAVVACMVFVAVDYLVYVDKPVLSTRTFVFKIVFNQSKKSIEDENHWKNLNSLTKSTAVSSKLLSTITEKRLKVRIYKTAPPKQHDPKQHHPIQHHPKQYIKQHYPKKHHPKQHCPKQHHPKQHHSKRQHQNQHPKLFRTQIVVCGNIPFM